MTPRHRHDCADCIYRGAIDGFDIYTCPQGGPTVVARYGDEGREYASGPVVRLGENLQLALVKPAPAPSTHGLTDGPFVVGECRECWAINRHESSCSRAPIDAWRAALD